MATLDFPRSPTIGDEYKYGNYTFRWDGIKWATVSNGSNPAEVLRSELLSGKGSSIIGFSYDSLANASAAISKFGVVVSAAPFLANKNDADNTTKINSAISFAKQNGLPVIFDALYQCANTVQLLDGVDAYATSKAFGVNFTGQGAAIKCYGNNRIVGMLVEGSNSPTSTTIFQDGIMPADNVKNIHIDHCVIKGFFAKGFPSNPPGMGRGVTLGAEDCSLTNSIIVDCRFCVNLTGKLHKINHNYISNNYLAQTVEAKPWTDQSAFWDGIVSEGLQYSQITHNTITDCGQSGIYTGGNGGYSIGNMIAFNFVEKCYNRGIDQGINTTKSSTNDVVEIVIIGNVCTNNRENNIWANSVTGCTISGNTCKYTDEYDTLFQGVTGGHINIGLQTHNNVDPFVRNTVTGNSLYDSSLRACIAMNFISGCTGNVVKSNSMNTPPFINDVGYAVSNKFDFWLEKSFTPVLIGGAGTVNLGTATGKVMIKDSQYIYDIVLSVSSVSTPSGMLIVGYLPYLSGVSPKTPDIRVTLYNGWDTAFSGQLVAYISGSPDQIAIARHSGGNVQFDCRTFLKAGSSLNFRVECII